MSARSRTRLVVLQVLVLSLLLTLGSRLWYLQVVTGEQYQRAAADNRTRDVVTPAGRGFILDDRGTPLVRNETALVVSVSRTAMLRQKDRGRALVARVAKVLGRPTAEIWGRTRLCGEPGAPKRRAGKGCWNGSPQQPIPVSDDADPRTALAILERRESFPGVTAELTARRFYPAPAGVNAAHLLGYVGPVGEEDAARPGSALRAGEQAGKAGLEKQYDAWLRGRPGVRSVAVDRQGGVSGTVEETDPTPGNHLVTSIDARVQAVAEQQLRAAIRRARTEGDINKQGRTYKADSGAVVVLDVRTGRVVAMASWPSYDPEVWVGGIEPRDYAAISGKASNYPMVSRPTQGEYAPASTFKVVSLPAAVQAGYALDGTYECSSSYRVGNRSFSNYESRAYGPITLERAINVSCDTVFYRFAHQLWLRDGGQRPVRNPKDPMVTLAKAYGLGKPTGIDLPAESGGRIADRRWKLAYWKATRAQSCERKAKGYPEVAVKDPERAAYLRKLASENCDEGWKFRGGDAVNFSIGQGDTTVTPLQMARVYAAIANGGTLWTPQLAKAVISPAGKVVKEFAPRAAGRLPVEPRVLAYLRNALRTTTEKGSGAGPFTRAEFPLTKIPVASKTGSGEVYGKQSTSWFASYAPATDPQYAVVMTISQGGTGSGVSGPSVAAIYKALFGVGKAGSVDAARAAIPGVAPPARLPRVAADGSITPPPGLTRGARR